MDAARVGLAVQSGVSIVCATCRRYWDGRERGLPDPKCTVVVPCASPFAGMDFPQYDGPITDFSRWCFVCGASATYGLAVPESERVIGICKEHVGLVEQLEPVGINGRPVTEVLTEAKRMARSEFFTVPRKTLGQAIQEVEDYFDDKERG